MPTVCLYRPATGTYVAVKDGFSWTSLFFGFLPLVFRRCYALFFLFFLIGGIPVLGFLSWPFLAIWGNRLCIWYLTNYAGYCPINGYPPLGAPLKNYAVGWLLVIIGIIGGLIAGLSWAWYLGFSGWR